MKRLLAAALLFMALPLAASAADADGDGVPDPAPAPAAPAESGTAPAESGGDPAGTSYGARGTYALDANGNKVSGDALSKLPPEARWAMETMGVSPILGNAGEVLGYDGGNISYLPDSIGKDYAAAAEKAKLGPGVQGPCPPNFPNCHSQEPSQPPPVTESDPYANMPANSKNHCDQPGPPPPCAPKEEKKEDPAKVAKEEADRAQQDMAAAAARGDREAAMAAAKARDEAERRASAADDAGSRSGSRTSFGPPGGDLAFDGPGPSPAGSTGGRDIGPQGQVGSGPGGAPGGGISGRQVKATTEQEVDAALAFHQGMKNGPLDGPSDPNVRSIAQTRLGGSVFESAKRIFGDLASRLAGDAESGFQTPDGVAVAGASDFHGATPVKMDPLKVVECKRDSLDGTAGGRTSRRIGGC